MHRVKLASTIVIAGAVAALFAIRPVSAATVNGTLAVNASVAPICIIGNATLNFGTYDPVGVHAAAPLDATTTFTISCAKGTAYSVGLGLGSHASGSTRRMAGGADFLDYELYLDSGRATAWGTTIPNVVSGAAASKSAITLTVYGRVFQNQDVGVASYTDTVQSTVTF